MALLVYVLWVSLVHSGSVRTPYGLKLDWTVGNQTGTFRLSMPAGMAADYDYWGVGWKPYGTEINMNQAEMWIVTKSGGFLSYLSQANEPPNPTQSCSAVMAFFHRDGDGFESVIVRHLQTSNINDIQLVEGASYTLLYAYGSLDSDTSTYTPHSPSDCGSVTLTLTHDIPSIPDSPEYPGSSSGSSLPESGFERTESLPLEDLHSVRRGWVTALTLFSLL